MIKEKFFCSLRPQDMYGIGNVHINLFPEDQPFHLIPIFPRPEMGSHHLELRDRIYYPDYLYRVSYAVFGKGNVKTCVQKKHETFVEHATGTVGNPMTDAAMEAKFLANASPVIGADRAGELCEMIWTLDSVDNVQALTALCG